MAEFDNHDNRKDHFSKAVKAGKRTYFFDVKATRSEDFYLTITESKKRFDQSGEKAFYEKHKIFLYKEDFDKFIEGLTEAVNFIKINKPEMPVREEHRDESGDNSNENKFTDIDFDDLGKKPDDQS